MEGTTASLFVRKSGSEISHKNLSTLPLGVDQHCHTMVGCNLSQKTLVAAGAAPREAVQNP